MLLFSHFEYLTFDCYGTLIDWETGIFSALRPILSAHGVHMTDAALLEMFGDLEASAEQGDFRPYRQVLQTVVRGFGERMGFKPSEEEVRSLPESLRNWLPFPDTVSALGRLKERYKLAIISNVDDDLFTSSSRRLQVAFDHVITAQQAGCYKPCREIFQMALRRLNTDPEGILHVGQSIYHDVIPAQSHRLSTVWVNRPSPRAGVGAVKPATGHPDLTVTSLAMLADLALTSTNSVSSASSVVNP